MELMEVAAENFFSSSYFAVAGQSELFEKDRVIDTPVVGASQAPHKFGYKGHYRLPLYIEVHTYVEFQY